MKPKKFMTLKNKYEYLATDSLGEYGPLEPEETWTAAASSTERISITLARTPGGAWVYGYIVCWARGGTSALKPGEGPGVFRTAREAKLHAVGFMLVYLEHFTEETQDALRAAEKSLVLLQLF